MQIKNSTPPTITTPFALIGFRPRNKVTRDEQKEGEEILPTTEEPVVQKTRARLRTRILLERNRKLHRYLFCCSSTVTDGRVVRRWPGQRGCSPRRDAHRPSNRSRAARPSFASFDLPATPKTTTTPCFSVLFNSPSAPSFGLRMPGILKAEQTRRYK